MAWTIETLNDSFYGRFRAHLARLDRELLAPNMPRGKRKSLVDEFRALYKAFEQADRVATVEALPNVVPYRSDKINSLRVIEHFPYRVYFDVVSASRTIYRMTVIRDGEDVDPVISQAIQERG